MNYGKTVLKNERARRENALLKLRKPQASDGPKVWGLIDSTPSLDKNSLYCNLLQCSHFAETCAVAELNGSVVGWLSGYLPPERTDTLFVWQVCVGEKVRGQGVATRLMGEVLARSPLGHVRYLECTITENNAASWALFGSIARAMGAQTRQSELFSRKTHFNGTHESELALTIGPFGRDQVASLAT